MPTEEGARPRRARYAILGAMGIVIATVFAVVASLASRPANHVQPVPDLPGPVIADSSTESQTTSTATVPSPASTVSTTAAPTVTSTVTTTTPAPATPGPKPPSALFAVDCAGLACTFAGGGSADPDGTIVSWAWNFGDNSGRNGQRLPEVTHTYRASGSYPVVLVLVDNEGRTGQASARITVTR